MMTSYSEFLQSKSVATGLVGIPAKEPVELCPHHHPTQRECTEFALRAGRAALFLDTGLGKSLAALDWARIVSARLGRPVLILTPLAVAPQFVREAAKFGLECRHIRDASEVDRPGVYVSNYERLHLLEPSLWGGIVLDESSILKNFTGKVRRQLQSAFADTPFRLCCTATPAPNDHMELGQHAEFLGVMESPEMLSRWFIADQDGMGKYRLKGHAVRSFWSWVASWARCVSKPSDLGHDDTGFNLPPLKMHRHIIAADLTIAANDDGAEQISMFRTPGGSATAVHREKRLTAAERAGAISTAVRAEPSEPWLIWVDTDYDATAILELLPASEAVHVSGKMKPDEKEAGLSAFTLGQKRIIVTKPSIAGFGLNWQHCARMAFVGISFSYEGFYQAIRRCWRFGQTRQVEVHVALSDTERHIWQTITRKQDDHQSMKSEMALAMRRASRQSKVMAPYGADQDAIIPKWIAA
jgi:hypothetical protein